MRKWELITDLFENKVGDSFPECPQDHPFKGLILLPIGGGTHFVDPKRYPQHFRLVKEPEFTESDMIEMFMHGVDLNKTQTGDRTIKAIIEGIRKRKSGK